MPQWPCLQPTACWPCCQTQPMALSTAMQSPWQAPSSCSSLSLVLTIAFKLYSCSRLSRMKKLHIISKGDPCSVVQNSPSEVGLGIDTYMQGFRTHPHSSSISWHTALSLGQVLSNHIFLLVMTFAGHCHCKQEYSYLSYNHYVIRTLEQVNSLVHTITEEPSTCELTIPFLFSSLTLDVNSLSVYHPIQAFLRTCLPFPTLDTECTWHNSHDEVCFAAPAGLARCLHWGLVHILHVSGDNAMQGLLS